MISELPGSLNFAINTNIIALLIIHNIRNLFNNLIVLSPPCQLLIALDIIIPQLPILDPKS